MSRPTAQPSKLPRRSFLIGSAAAALTVVAASEPAFADSSSPTVDASQFGTDDVAIQRVIDAADAGATISFRPGAYQISNPLIITKPLTLEGTPSARLIAVAASNIPAVISVNGTQSVTIRGLTIDGNSNPHAWQGILVDTCQDIRIERVRIHDLVLGTGFGPHGIYFSRLVTDSVITNNAFRTIGTASAWGAAVRISGGSSRNTITNNTVDHTGRGGILTNGNSDDLVVSHNQISNIGTTSEGLGIEVNESKNSLIEHNSVGHWISLSPSSLTAVRNNVVHGSRATPKFAGLELVASTDVVMTNNHVLGGQMVGLSVSNAALKERIFIGHNKFLNSLSDGILLQGNTGGLQNLYLFDNQVAATTGEHDFPWFGYEGTGISLHGNERAITFENNSIMGNALDAIRFLRPEDLDYFAGGIDQLEFIGNELIGNAGRAVGGLPLNAEDVSWKDNLVVGNRGGNDSLQSVGFQDVPAPGLNLSLPRTAHVGQEVAPILSGPNDAGTQYLWDFDSGLPQTGREAVITYTTRGLYEVNVVAWTEAGRAQRLSAKIAVGG